VRKKGIEIKQLIRPFELKEINVEERTFSGYAGAFGNIDEGNDILEKGSCARTFAQRIPAGHIKFIDQHSYGGTERLLGKVIEGVEDDYGPLVKIYVSAVKAGDEVLTKIKEKVLDALSFGYDTLDFSLEERNGMVVRRLKEIRMWEVSAVIFGMNPLALINSESVKSVPSMQTWPLAAEDRAWDSTKAVRSCRKWASTDGSGDKDTIDWKKYKKCFFYYDPADDESFGGYKLCYVEVIDGKPKAIPRGIFAVAAVLQGARGGVDIPDADKTKIKGQVESWYKKMDRTAPWKGLILLSAATKAMGMVDEIKEGRVLSASSRKLVVQSIEVLNALLDASESPEKALLKAQGLASKEEIKFLEKELSALNIRLTATNSIGL